MCNDVLVCCVRTGCAKIQRFSLKTENSKQQKTDVKTNINVQHSYSHGLAIHLDDRQKTRAATVYLPSEEVHKQARSA